MENYNVIYSERKTLSLHIDKNGELVVRAPLGTDRKFIEKVVSEQEKWIEKTEKRVAARKEKYDGADVNELKKRAAEVIPFKVRHYAELIGVKPSAVKINSARTRFGSCSGKNSINFSCYLMLFPDEAVDYVVVHELCHILHHDHSPAFYREIEKILPDYRKREKLLK